MIIHRFKHYILALLAGALSLTACVNDRAIVGDEPDPSSPPAVEEKVTSISVSKGAPKKVAGTTPIDERLNSTEFPVGSKIYISQLGATTTPNFPSNYTLATKNFYAYQHYKNPDANWDNGYNFTLAENSNPIDWSIIKGYGSVGNSFALYALYFPSGNVSTSVNDANPNVYAVTEWQNNRTDESILYFDIMGAYHTFSSLYSRLRFRMYHLMTCVRLTLLLPVEEVTKNGTTGFAENAFHTTRHQTTTEVRNFIPGAFLGASYEHAGGNFRNVSRMWRIDYNANRSSDREGPLVETIKISNNLGLAPNANICMYPHNDEDDESPDAGFKMATINPKEFYPNADRDRDQVRVYEFTAFLPPQTLSGELMYFHIKPPGTPDGIFNNEASIRRYYFSTSQLLTGKNEIEFTQGTINHITLYIPRSENNTVLVSADVLPWTEAFTDMTVMDEDELKD